MVDALCAVVNNQMKRQAQESEEEEPANVEKFDVTYKDLMAKIVRDTTSQESSPVSEEEKRRNE